MIMTHEGHMFDFIGNIVIFALLSLAVRGSEAAPCREKRKRSGTWRGGLALASGGRY